MQNPEIRWRTAQKTNQKSHLAFQARLKRVAWGSGALALILWLVGRTLVCREMEGLALIPGTLGAGALIGVWEGYSPFYATRDRVALAKKTFQRVIQGHLYVHSYEFSRYFNWCLVEQGVVEIGPYAEVQEAYSRLQDPGIPDWQAKWKSLKAALESLVATMPE